jgi:hypothetical protein
METQKSLRVAFFHFYPMTNAHCNHFPELHITKQCPMPGLAIEVCPYLLEVYYIRFKILNIQVTFLDYSTGR